MLVSILYQQSFGRGRGDSRALKLPDFAALPVNLGAHSFDFGPEVVKLHVRSRSARAISISRRTAVVGRASLSRSRSRFHSLMVSRSSPVSIPL
jgi:hypothetical protein